MNLSENPLVQCFDHQYQMMIKFHEIESNNLKTYHPQNHSLYHFEMIDYCSYEGQRRLRELAWRIFEEIGELLDARYKEMPQSEQYEEIADAFHFLVEFFLVCGLNPSDFGSGKADALKEIQKDIIDFTAQWRPAEEAWICFLRELAMTLNVLKTKPWKATPKPFDYPLFRFRTIRLLETFVLASFCTGLPPSSLVTEYFKKAQINTTRIESGV